MIKNFYSIYESFKTSKVMHRTLQNIFSFSSFREGQQEIIEHTLQKKNSLLLMPTGAGKSLCFQLPAVMFGGLTLVISPLIALMEDQARSLREKNILAQAIHSNLSKEKRRQILNHLDKLSLLYVSPERFRDNNFYNIIQKTKVHFLVIDEAHCISQWGFDFRPDYLKLKEIISLLKNPVVMATTATATYKVQRDIISLLGFSSEQMKIFNYGMSRNNLHYQVKEVMDQSQKFEDISEEIKNYQEKTGIIYFTLIKNLEKFSNFLQEKKIKHLIFHGQLSIDVKKIVYQKFSEKSSLLLLATNAFGMGVDRPDIRFIIHAEIPSSIEAYVQESGRAGRDEKDSFCILYFCQDDLAVQLDFLEYKFPQINFMQQVFQFLKSKPKGVHWDYQELQEKMVYKNKYDHRLQSTLLLFERYGVTKGSLDTFNLELTKKDFPQKLQNKKLLDLTKQEAQQRLVQIVQYVRLSDKQRKNFLEDYFRKNNLKENL